MNSIVCQYCNKEFSSLNNLKIHKKTAKYCLEIQEKLIQDISQCINECEYCKKKFTTKYNLTTHLKTCKSKKEKEKEENLTKIIHEKNNEKNIKFEEICKEFEVRIDQIKKNHIYEVNKLEEQNKYLNEQNKYLKDELEYYKKKQDQYVKDAINKPTNTTVTTNNNYQIQYNQMVENIEPFTKENLLKHVSELENNPPYLFSNNGDVKKTSIDTNDNLGRHLSLKLESLAFATDPSRGTIVIKDENNVPKKINIETFSQDCIGHTKPFLLNCVAKCKKDIDDEYSMNELNDNEYSDRLLSLASVKRNILNNHELNPLHKATSGYLIKGIPHLSKT